MLKDPVAVEISVSSRTNQANQHFACWTRKERNRQKDDAASFYVSLQISLARLSFFRCPTVLQFYTF